MRKTSNIVLPKGAIVLETEEMRKVEGGSIQLATSSAYLNKSACQQVAAELLRSGAVKGMTALEISQEIYAHAVVCYKFEWVKDYPIAGDIYESAANGIYIQDGGDTAKRKAFYSTVWTLF